MFFKNLKGKCLLYYNIVKGVCFMKTRTIKCASLLLVLFSMLCGCSTIYIEGPDNYRIKLNRVLQADERYISILSGSGTGKTVGEAILSATENASKQQSAKGWNSYDLRLLQQNCEHTSDGYMCTQLNLVFERPEGI